MRRPAAIYFGRRAHLPRKSNKTGRFACRMDPSLQLFFRRMMRRMTVAILGLLDESSRARDHFQNSVRTR
jgi:hypothetical protein